MKPRVVSAVAMLFCCAICAIVGVFGYSRYKAAQIENAAFRAQLQSGAHDQQGTLPTHMPDQMPQRDPGEGAASPSPAPQP